MHFSRKLGAQKLEQAHFYSSDYYVVLKDLGFAEMAWNNLKTLLSKVAFA